MLHVLLRRGLNFDEMLRSYMEEGVEWISRDNFYRACMALGLPFTSKQLYAIFHTYQVDHNYLNTEALLNDLFSRMEGSVYAPRSADSVSSSDMLLNGGDTVVWDGPNAGVSILVNLRRMILEASERTARSFDDIYRMFSRWDVGGTGTVTATQFLRVLSHLHVQFSEQDQDLLVELLDTNGEGRVDFDSLMTFCIGEENNNLDTLDKFSTYNPHYLGEDHTIGASVESGEAAKSIDPEVPVAAPPSPMASSHHQPVTGRRKLEHASSGIVDLSVVKPPGGRIRPRTASVDSNRPQQLREEVQRIQNNSNRLTVISTDASSGQSSDPQYAVESPGNMNRASNLKQPRRPLTANARVPDTVSIKKRSAKSSDGMPTMDEFVVDVLSDDDIIDDDGDPNVFTPIEQITGGGVGRKSFEHSNDASYQANVDAKNADVRFLSYEQVVPPIQDHSHQFLNKGSDAAVNGAFDSMTYDSLNLRQSGESSPTNIPMYINEAQGGYVSSSLPHYKLVSEEPHDIHALSVGPYGLNNQVLPIIQPPQGYFGRVSEQPVLREVSAFTHLDANTYGSYSKPRGAETQLELKSSMRPQAPDTTSYTAAPFDGRRSGFALVKALRKEILNRHKNSGKTLYEIFRSFDIIGNRYFGPKDVQRAASGFGLRVDDSEAVEMIEVLGLDGEHRVSFGEFAVFITDPDFAILQHKANNLIAQQYKLHGREYQLRLYNTLMLSSANNDHVRAAAAPNSNAVATGFIEKTLFEKALIDLGLVERPNPVKRKSGSHLLSHVEVSRLAVRYDTHGRDQCSVAKFLRTLQSSEEWKRAEHYVSLMEEAAEEAQTAREELFQSPDKSQDGLYRSPNGIILNEELIDMAEYLGIRILSEPYLLWIVDSALRAPLPEGWSTHTDKKGRSFYFNRVSGISQWDHPADDEFRRLIDEYRAVFEAYRQKELESRGPVENNQIAIQEKFLQEYPPSIVIPNDTSSSNRVPRTENHYDSRFAADEYEIRRDLNYGHIENQESRYTQNFVSHERFVPDKGHRTAYSRTFAERPLEYSDQSNAVVRAIRLMNPVELLQVLNRGVDVASLAPMSGAHNHNNGLIATPNPRTIMNSMSAPRLNASPVIDKNIMYPQSSSSRPVTGGKKRSPKNKGMTSASDGNNAPTIVDRVIGSVRTIYSPTFEDANRVKKRDDGGRSMNVSDRIQSAARRETAGASSTKAQEGHIASSSETSRHQTATRPNSSHGLKPPKGVASGSSNSRPSSSHGPQLLKGSNAASKVRVAANTTSEGPYPSRNLKPIETHSFVEEDMFGQRLLNRLDNMVGRNK
jgi:Ca2+-binding EF-hand superfamily protein